MLRSQPVSQHIQSKDILISQYQNNHHHKCYFHNTKNIIKFCINKKCTLPLCQKCIPIHIKQHTKEEKTLGKENILLYSDAHKIALQQLSSTLNKKQQKMQKIQLTVKNIRSQIEHIIDRYFAQIDTKLSDNFDQIKILSQKQTKIKKGSLKTLIFYYADQQGFKIISQSNRNSTLNLSSQILKLTQKLNNQLKKLDLGNDTTQCASISYRQNQVSSVPQLKEFQSIKKSDQQSIKLQTSSDFAHVLKDQINRLENVRNKNIMYALNNDSIKQDDNTKKYGSKSVDNFYSNNVHKENYQNKDQKQNRPLQFGFKTSSQGFSLKKQGLQDNLNSQQKIDKIRKKYIRDQSLSKQKRQFTEQLRRQPLGTIKTKNPRSIEQIQINLSDRLLSREQIRLDIEKKLQQKVIKNPFQHKKQFVPRSLNLRQENHQTFRKLNSQQLVQNSLINRLINRQQQFTLNKNNFYNETQKLLVEKEKILMSSIKKQLKAVPTDESRPKQTRFESFYQENNRQKLSSFDVRQEKNSQLLNQIQNKRQISDFLVNRIEGTNSENHIKNQFNKKKEKLYQETRQHIRLSEPKLTKVTDKISKKGQQVKQNRQIGSKAQSTQKNTKEGRRFNYLYDSCNANQSFNRAL